MSDDDMVSANEARDLLDGYDALKSSPECSGACARAAAPELARTVVALHERVAAVEAERDGALAHAEELTQALRATIEGRTTPPTTGELEEHAAAGGAWLVTLPEVKQVRFKPETRYVDDLREAHRLWWCEGARWVAVMHGRPCAWPGDVP